MSGKLAALLSLLVVAACATAPEDSIVTTAPSGAVERIPARLLKPEGAGPFPAVVMLHDCSGLGPRSSGAPGRWANELVAHGYAVIMPDSFTTRGFPGGVCTDTSPARANVAPRQRARDAYAALAHLRTLAFIDGARVGLMGGSHGGSSTLVAMLSRRGTADGRSGFAAAVALYPGCAAPGGALIGDSGVYRALAPLLILVGELDDWTPAEPCRRLAHAAQKAGYPVAIKVYPGAYHSFDNNNPQRYVAARVNANSPTGRGATTGGNAEAWADSIREVLAFFQRNLVEKR